MKLSRLTIKYERKAKEESIIKNVTNFNVQFFLVSLSFLWQILYSYKYECARQNISFSEITATALFFIEKDQFQIVIKDFLDEIRTHILYQYR